MSIEASHNKAIGYFFHERNESGWIQKVKYKVEGSPESLKNFNVQKIQALLKEMEQRFVILEKNKYPDGTYFSTFDPEDLPRVENVKTIYAKTLNAMGVTVTEVYDNTFECRPS